MRYSSFEDDGLLVAQPEFMNLQKEPLLDTYSPFGLFINFEKSKLVPKHLLRLLVTF